MTCLVIEDIKITYPNTKFLFDLELVELRCWLDTAYRDLDEIKGDILSHLQSINTFSDRREFEFQVSNHQLSWWYGGNR
jgi:hypothetical protein